MAFYVRKRVKIAPGVALNLSKSGLGLSVGPRGFKVSSGPRGTQINAGRGGIYYRKSLNSKRGRKGTAQQVHIQVRVPQQPAPLGQVNGVVAEGRQPCTGRWPNKSRPPVFAIGSWQFWVIIGACALIVLLAGAS